jgi:hypothetical protein
MVSVGRLTLASMAMRFSAGSVAGGKGRRTMAGPAGMGPKYFSIRPLVLGASRSPATSRMALLGA